MSRPNPLIKQHETISMLEHILRLLNNDDITAAKRVLNFEINKRKQQFSSPNNSPVTSGPKMVRVQSRTFAEKISIDDCDLEEEKPKNTRVRSSFQATKSFTWNPEDNKKTGIIKDNTLSIPTGKIQEKVIDKQNNDIVNKNINDNHNVINIKESNDSIQLTPPIKHKIIKKESRVFIDPEEMILEEEINTNVNVGNRKYNLILSEIIQTERDYIRDLQVVVDVFIIPFEKKNIISKTTIDALFSNWTSLLGINKELLRQIEGLSGQRRESRILIPKDRNLINGRERSVLVRITFPKEHASKALLVTPSHSGADVIEMAIKKVATSLPGVEQKMFKEHYETCELYDDHGTLSASLPFLDQLKTENSPCVSIRKAQKQAKNIGECFLKLASYIQIYSGYCNNQVAAAELLAKLSENQTFLTFIEDCQFDDPRCRKRDLSSFLIIPLQRICKYPLLLKRLLESTPETSPEYETLLKATQLLTDAVQSINNKKRDIEIAQKLLTLQNNIICTKGLEIFAPSRKYIQEGNAEMLIDGNFKDITYFLFNDLFLSTSKNPHGKYLVLRHMEIIDACLTSNVTGYPQAIAITTRQENPVILRFIKKDTRSDFIKLLSDTIYEERKERYYSWITTQKLRGFVTNKSLEEWLEMFFPDTTT